MECLGVRVANSNEGWTVRVARCERTIDSLRRARGIRKEGGILAALPLPLIHPHIISCIYHVISSFSISPVLQ